MFGLYYFYKKRCDCSGTDIVYGTSFGTTSGRTVETTSRILNEFLPVCYLYIKINVGVLQVQKHTITPFSRESYNSDMIIADSFSQG